MEESSIISRVLGVLLVLSLLILGFLYCLREDPPETTARTSVRRKEKPRASEQIEALPVFQEATQPSLLPEAAAQEVSREMDRTSLRFNLQQLRMAALNGDAVTVGSLQEAFRRAGRSSDGFLQEELQREPDPYVREVLVATRALLR